MAEVNYTVTTIVWIIILTIVFFLFFWASRYQKFTTNVFVMHFRNGKVKSSGLGGKIIKLPLIDEIIVIPTTTRRTLLDAREKILSREYQDMKIVAVLYWRVSDPAKAYSAVVWDPRSPDYVEKVLQTVTEAIIRTTCASLEIEKIIRERSEILKLVSDQLLKLTKDWGIVIESLEIIEVTVLDAELKKNLEAVKKIQEEQKARLASADAQEIYRMRELEVERKVGVTSEQTQSDINVQLKKKEVNTQVEENNRLILEAEAKKKAAILKAEGEAEAIRLNKVAALKAEADGLLQKMEAQAEGMRKQVAAISATDEKFLQIKLIEILPQIFQSIKPEKLLMMGEGKDAFTSLAQAIMPFLEILPAFSNNFKQLINKSNDVVVTESDKKAKK